MTDKLLAIIEVPKEDKVLCQLDGCKHPVYKQIHVVDIDSKLMVIGSSCYKKHFSELIATDNTPKYTSATGKALTDEERELLRNNTEALVEKLKLENQERIAKGKERERLQKIETENQNKLNEELEKKKRERLANRDFANKPKKVFQRGDRYKHLTEEQVMAIALDKAKDHFRKDKGVNPELPGWVGWVNATAKEYFEKMIRD